ncbi:hypothetical protein C1S80_12825 [Mycolicibacterium aubagnense]|nr:hypothetical protein C1S80_12825 [Mycolicibacterium aubagnense]
MRTFAAAVLATVCERILVPTAISTTIVAIWGVCVFASIVHQCSTALCIPCVRDMPVDAPDRARRQKLLLRLSHFGSTWVGFATLLFFCAGVPAIVRALYPNAAPELLQIPGLVWIVPLVYARSIHRKLRPWCPYCRDWREGGDYEPSPAPVAFGIKTER